MMQLDAHTWQLIGSVVRGEANEEEEAAFREWLSRSPDHEKIFQEAKQAWEESLAIQSHLSFDAEAAKARVRARLSNASQQEGPVPQPVRPSSRQVLISWEFWAKMAAVVTFIGLSAWLARSLQRWEGEGKPQAIAQLEKATGKGQRLILQLEDGTQVKLNSSSTLIYPESFDDQLREVTLVGEAYFEVAPDPDRPFVVRTGNVETKVLGTAFNVLFDPAEGDTEVAVAEGKVAVKTPDLGGNSLQRSFYLLKLLPILLPKGWPLCTRSIWMRCLDGKMGNWCSKMPLSNRCASRSKIGTVWKSGWNTRAVWSKAFLLPISAKHWNR